MKIQDAFDQDAIDEAQTDLDPAEEVELKQLVTQLFQANTMDYDESLLNLIVVVFTAGRTYQADQQPPMIEVSMSPEMASEFMGFLVARSTNE